MRKGPIFEYLDGRSKESKYDSNPAYGLVRELVWGYSRVATDALTVRDLDLLYLMTTHSTDFSTKARKKKVEESSLLEESREKLIEMLDRAEAELGDEPRYGFFGRGFGTFAKGARPCTDEDARRFIRMCCEIIDLTGQEEVLTRVEQVLSKKIPNMGKGSASQILHMLRPEIFPVINNWGNKIIKQALGWKEPIKLKSYLRATREILEEKEAHFKFDNMLVIDQLPKEIYEADLEVNNDGTEASVSTAPSSSSLGSRLATDHPLNQILYGPPGTGKTYVTASMALQICGVPVPEDRKGVMREYNRMMREGRIKFVTFHQSYGYEEFVEGIRPVLPDSDAYNPKDDGDVRYEVTAGVFKALCEMAMNPHRKVARKFIAQKGKTRLWKMSLGNTALADDAHIFDDCIENGHVLLGWGQGLDFTGCDSRNAVKKKLETVLPGIDHYDYNITAIELFKNRMRKDDLVVVSQGNRKVRAIGKIVGDYEFYKPEEYGQFRKVEWLLVPEEPIASEKIISKSLSQMTLYELGDKAVKFDALNALLSGEETEERLNHVLIIDEINRGNISKILGELITLLEHDKRLGPKDKGLQVTLPYSKEDFGVPDNVYLLGTMNTADRSIALLDTALRRRFNFVEMMPDANVIKEVVPHDGVVDGIDVAALLEIMNERIELLYDRDHMLGHSFFLGVNSLEDLREAFLTKVIPMLQEYFYGDFDKLCFVLGCPVDRENGARLVNGTPIIHVENLKSHLPSSATIDEHHLRLRYTIDETFLTAEDEDLRPFFETVLGKSASTNEDGRGA